jgi:hypothetical protein
MGAGGLEPARPTHCKHKDLCTQQNPGGAESGAFTLDSGPAGPASDLDLPPDVAELACRLAALPETVRAQIVATLKTERVPKNWERGVGILCVGKKTFFPATAAPVMG